MSFCSVWFCWSESTECHSAECNFDERSVTYTMYQLLVCAGLVISIRALLHHSPQTDIKIRQRAYDVFVCIILLLGPNSLTNAAYDIFETLLLLEPE